MRAYQLNDKLTESEWSSYMMGLKQALANSNPDVALRQITTYYYDFKQNNYDLFRDVTMDQMKTIDSRIIQTYNTVANRSRIFSKDFFSSTEVLPTIKQIIRNTIGSPVVVVAPPKRKPTATLLSDKLFYGLLILGVLLMVGAVVILFEYQTHSMTAVGLIAATLVVWGVAPVVQSKLLKIEQART